jgi:alpha-L-fucosidase
MASWMSLCGEGIYGTRPWRLPGEGYSSVLIEGFREEAVAWTETDFRFTSKKNTVYAYMMKAPEAVPGAERPAVVIRSFGPGEKVVSVRLLGGGQLSFSQNYGVLTVKLPEKLPTPYANCLAVELAG